MILLVVSRVARLVLLVCTLVPCPAAAVNETALESGNGTQGLSIAVIGGGAAGAITTLELLRRKEVSKITLFEQADRIGHIKSASGIIAALLVFDADDEYWNCMDDVDDYLEKAKWIHVDRPSNWERLAKFSHKAAWYKLQKDTRAQKAYQARFFNQSGEVLKQLVNWKPELCEAIIGPFCCKPGSPSYKWMQDEGKKKGLSCDFVRGVAHAFSTADDWSLANNKLKAKKGNWTLWELGSKELAIVESYIEKKLKGVVFQEHEGFCRVELLFPILTKIFEDSGKVDLALNCNVRSMKPKSTDPSAGVQVITNPTPGCKPNGTTFDRVIVAAGAGSVPVLAEVDGMLPWQMIPVKGFAVANDHDFILKQNRMIGVEFEEPGQYIRANENGGIHYGFGRVVGTFEDELLDPQFSNWNNSLAPGLTGLGRKMLAMNNTKKLAGFRPVSSLGNFPLVKAFTGHWSNILLNTGFGFYGYGMTWKSAEIVVDVALHGKPHEVEWTDAVEYTDGECPWQLGKLVCFPIWVHILVYVLTAAVGFGVVFVVVRWCYNYSCGDPDADNCPSCANAESDSETGSQLLSDDSARE